MDDIKESVRLAAAKTVAALSRACIKMCDVTQSPKSGEAAVRAILVRFSILHSQIYINVFFNLNFVFVTTT
jgi:hypothetical protein